MRSRVYVSKAPLAEDLNGVPHLEVEVVDSVAPQPKWAKTVHSAEFLTQIPAAELENLGLVCRGVDRAVENSSSNGNVGPLVFCGVGTRGTMDLGVVAAKYCALRHNLDRVAIISDRREDSSMTLLQGDENFLLLTPDSGKAWAEARDWRPDVIVIDCGSDNASRVAEVLNKAVVVVAIVEADSMGFFVPHGHVGASASEGTDERGRRDHSGAAEDEEDEEEIGIEASEKEKVEDQAPNNLEKRNDNEDDHQDHDEPELDRDSEKNDGVRSERKREREDCEEEVEAKLDASVRGESVEPMQLEQRIESVGERAITLATGIDCGMNPASSEPEKETKKADKRARVDDEDEEEAEVNILEDDKPMLRSGEGEEDSQEGTAREGPDLVMDFDLSEKSFTEVEKLSEKSLDRGNGPPAREVETFVAPASVVAPDPDAGRGRQDVDELDMEEINALIGEELGDIAV